MPVGVVVVTCGARGRVGAMMSFLALIAIRRASDQRERWGESERTFHHQAPSASTRVARGVRVRRSSTRWKRALRESRISYRAAPAWGRQANATRLETRCAAVIGLASAGAGV